MQFNSGIDGVVHGPSSSDHRVIFPSGTVENVVQSAVLGSFKPWSECSVFDNEKSSRAKPGGEIHPYRCPFFPT